MSKRIPKWQTKFEEKAKTVLLKSKVKKIPKSRQPTVPLIEESCLTTSQMRNAIEILNRNEERI